MKLQFTTQPHQDVALLSIAFLFHDEGDLARKYIRDGTMLLDSVGSTLFAPVGFTSLGQ